ncbi:MAG: DNA topology modulation protein [Pyrinomonadaceae bacterium]
MRKVLVIGSGGSGKSTFARRLGALLDLEVIHLDSIYWSPGWVEMPKPDWNRTVEELLTRNAWIIDGNYSGTLEMRLEACDTVIFLDLSRVIYLWRLLKRAVLYRNERRPDMAEGCPEKLNWEFIKWVWGYRKRTRPKIIKRLENNAKQIIWLKSPTEVKRFLVTVSPPKPASGRKSAWTSSTQN